MYVKGAGFFVATVDILGVPFSASTENEVFAQCTAFMADSQPHFVITAGPEFVMKVGADRELQHALAAADLITPDGIGIVIASRWYSQPLAERVTGVDLVQALLPHAAKMGLRVYVLGASEHSLQRALAKIRETYPTLHIAGQNGYFKHDSVMDVITAIREEAPHLLLVGLGQPVQEKFLATHLDALGIPLAIGVGGAIDVLGGTVKRAPVLFQKAKLEWLYRLLKEPSRVRRQMALPRFAIAAWWDAKNQVRGRSTS